MALSQKLGVRRAGGIGAPGGGLPLGGVARTGAAGSTPLASKAKADDDGIEEVVQLETAADGENSSSSSKKQQQQQQQQHPADAAADAAAAAAVTLCSICMEPADPEAPPGTKDVSQLKGCVRTKCGRVAHVLCVEGLKFMGVSTACPFCSKTSAPGQVKSSGGNSGTGSSGSRGSESSVPSVCVASKSS